MKFNTHTLASLCLVLAVASCGAPREHVSTAGSTPPNAVESSVAIANLPAKPQSPITASGAYSMARTLCAEARTAEERGDRVLAGKRAEEAVDALLAWSAEQDTTRWINLLSELSRIAQRVGQIQLAGRAYERVRDFDLRYPLGRVGDDDGDSTRENAPIQDPSTRAVPASANPRTREEVPPNPPIQKKAAAPAEPMKTTPKLDERSELERKIALQDQVVEHMAETLSPDDPDLLEQRLLLAQLHELAGNIEAAKTQYAEVLAAYLRLLAKSPDAKNDPKLQPIRMQLAKMALAQSDFTTAVTLYQHAIDVDAPTRSEGDPDLVNAQEGQALALVGLGELARAQPLFQAILEARSKSLPEDDAAIRSAQEHLTAVLEERQRGVAALSEKGESAPALALQQEVLAGFRMLPAGRPDHIRAKERMASLLQTECRFIDALALRQDILEVLRQNASKDPQELDEARRELAALLRVMGRTDDARRLER